MIIEEDGSNSVSSVGTEELWKDREEALRVEDEEGFESDITLMEGLFDNPKKRY